MIVVEGYEINKTRISKDGLVIKYEEAKYSGCYLYMFVYDLDIATIKFDAAVEDWNTEFDEWENLDEEWQ